MADDPARLETVRQMLRRKYRNDLTGLTALWDSLTSAASESVEITGRAFEGGSAQGVQVFSRLGYLQAVQDVLDELDPDNAPDQPPGLRHADFSQGALET